MTSEIMLIILILLAIYLILDEVSGNKTLSLLSYILLGYSVSDAKSLSKGK